MRPKKFYICCDFANGTPARIIEGSVEARRLKAFGPYSSRERAEEFAMWLLYNFEQRIWGPYRVSEPVLPVPPTQRTRRWAYPSNSYRWLELPAITPRDKNPLLKAATAPA